MCNPRKAEAPPKGSCPVRKQAESTIYAGWDNTVGTTQEGRAVGFGADSYRKYVVPPLHPCACVGVGPLNWHYDLPTALAGLQEPPVA